MNFISTYNLNIENLIFLDSDCTKSQDFEELICENEGSFSREGEYMIFDMNGNELVISYDLSVSGRVDYDPGDYWTPPSCDIDIDYEDISVTDVTLDEYNIELTKELRLLFSDLIKKFL